VLRHRRLSAACVGGVLGGVEDLGLGWFLVTDRHRTVASESLRARVHEVAIWDPHIDFVGADHRVAEGGYILHLVGPPDAVRAAQERLPRLGLADVETFHGDFWGGWDQLQVRPSGIGKDVGLRHVLDHLGLGAEHVLAAGDWLNDVAMLRMARVAVAPANARPEVSALAHHRLTGTCDDDAVPRFLADALRDLR
jgi:hypothetical protein